MRRSRAISAEDGIDDAFTDWVRVATRAYERAWRPNVLVIGDPDTCDAVVSALVLQSPKPVCEWRGETPLPAHADAPCVLIRDVATLSRDQQEAFWFWLSAADVHHPQFISTSSIPVFPLVERGAFMEDLYYRLNTLVLAA
jgi:hypothetical protein